VPVAPVLLPVQPDALPDLVRRSYDAVHALGGGIAETSVDASGADYFFDSLCNEILPPHILILGNSPAQSHRDD
jgi:hypothetical protein